MPPGNALIVSGVHLPAREVHGRASAVGQMAPSASVKATGGETAVARARGSTRGSSVALTSDGSQREGGA